MVKTTISATIDPEIATLAYQKISNVSGFIENALRIELDMKARSGQKTDKEIIEELKIANAHLINELQETAKKLKESNDMNKIGGFDGFRKV